MAKSKFPFYETKRDRLESLRTQLDNEYYSFEPQYRAINDFLLPSEGRFSVSDYNRGQRRNLDIINSHGTMSANNCHAGMMSGITSPARPWFKLASEDPDLNKYGPVRRWNETVADRMASIFLKSNLYQTLPYRVLCGFGTSAMSVEYDTKKTLQTHAYPIGSYRLAKDNNGIVNTFYREWSMSIRNLVKRFGAQPDGSIDWSNLTGMVKNQWDQGNYEIYVVIAHCIQPNADYIPGSPFAKQKQFESVYYERGFSSNKANGRGNSYIGSGPDRETYLEESGFDNFPILAPRWYVTGEDVYATDCPGMTSIGDLKQLQHSEQKFGKGLDRLVDPTIILPTSLREQRNSMVPGGVVYTDIKDGKEQAQSLYNVNFRIDHLDNKIDKIQSRISRNFYEDLFLLLANDRRSNITAREVEERHEEKLLALGPVLERLNVDLLNPLIDITFNYMLRQGMIPRAPDELQDQDLKVEYVSIMAQAQKTLGVASDERFLGQTMNIASVDPGVMDKVNLDKWVERYADRLSVSADIIRSDEEVAEIKQAQAQAQQAAALAENLPKLAGTAKTLSETDTNKESALTAVSQGI
jgi:hypothetical protein